jgi:predicted acylesterase/phospholipase RssA
MRSALVLKAGGITGIAWQLGLITGLREAGVDLTTADPLVGTSAESVTGTLLAAGVDPVDGQRLEARLATPTRRSGPTGRGVAGVHDPERRGAWSGVDPGRCRCADAGRRRDR